MSSKLIKLNCTLKVSGIADEIDQELLDLIGCEIRERLEDFTVYGKSFQNKLMIDIDSSNFYIEFKKEIDE